MEFLRVVEEELRGLAAEARRRHPVVQEAAERAILKLRNMREEYAVALRQQHGGQAPPLSMFRSQDLLRPFLLACNHSDASPHLIIMAMGSMQYLINRDAILPSDAPNILRVLGIQSQSKDADVQKRVLQTMVMVVTWRSCEMKEDTMAQALSVCLGLHDAKSSMVRTAAHMTVRQIISLLFDRVAEELRVTKLDVDLYRYDNAGAERAATEEEEGADEEVDEAAGAQGALRCAELVFQDLCVLSRGEQGQWIKRTSVSTTLGLELVEQVLAQQPLLFRRFQNLNTLLSREVYPLILQTLRRRMTFPLLVRVSRCAGTLSVMYGDLLPSEAQAILSTMLSSLGSGIGSGTDEGRDGEGAIEFSPIDDGSGGCVVSWPALLTIETAHQVLSSPELTFRLFRHAGPQAAAATVVEELVHGVSQYIVRNLGSQHSTQAFEQMAHSIRLGRMGSGSSSSEGRRLPLPAALAEVLARGTVSDDRGEGTPTSGRTKAKANSSSTRSSSSELLHETEEPSLSDAEPLLWALQCIVDFSAAVASLVDQEFGTADASAVVSSDVAVKPGEALTEGSRRDILRRLCQALWGPVLSCLSHVLVYCSDPLLVATAADGYKAFAYAGGVLGLENLVDGFMGSLCRFSLPQWHGNDVVVGGGAGVGGGGGGGGAGGSSQGGGSPALGWNHVGALQSLLLVAHRLGNLLRGSWHVVLDTLEQAATLLTRRAIARPRWSPNCLAEAELAAVEENCVEVYQAVERLVQFSTCLEDDALYTLMSSLQALAVVDLANSATLLPQERTARDVQQGGGQPNPGVGPGAAAVAAASGLAAMVGAAARAAMSGPEGREFRDPRNANAGSGGKTPKGGDGKARNPWVSSRLVVECAVANTWRLSVVWELVSGHLRVVAKAREPTTRAYAVRALSELIVDGVQRLHGVHPNADALPTTSIPPANPALPQPPVSTGSTPTSRGDTPPKSSGVPATGQGGGGAMAGFIPSLSRGRSDEGRGSEDEEGFRWVFDGDVAGVFVGVGRGGRRGQGAVVAVGDGFEGVLFETMGLFALTPHIDTREAMLQTLYTILQSCGQVLESAWTVILNLLYSVAKAATDAPQPPSPPPPPPARAPNTLQSVQAEEDRNRENEESLAEKASAAWGGGCLSLAFKCLHLIVDDFLERVPREEIPKLVMCTGAFGGQTESVNLSLTAIGMLWSVCDTFADDVAQPQMTPSASPGMYNDHASLHSMWPAMLFELRSLSVDFRPELRNCAVNTLFSAAVGNGAGLTEGEWKQFLLEVTFPLLAKVLDSTNSASRGANTAVAPELKKGVRMLMHHTRDTDRKQWNETRVLAMQGLGRVLRAYVGALAKHDWFCGEGGVWAQSLQVYRDACLLGSDSQEVALAGVDGISTMVLLVGRMGLKSVQVRAGTGMKIVDGTLQRSPSRRRATSGSAGQGGGNAAVQRGGAEETTSTPEFARVRPALFDSAWMSMVEASRFAVDESGDVAPEFLLGLGAVYKAGMEEGAEFHPQQEGAEQRTRELFDVLESLMLPRVAAADPNKSASSDSASRRRAVYMPNVTPGQRSILDFLQEDLQSGWQLALHLLAKFSVAGAVGSAGGISRRRRGSYLVHGDVGSGVVEEGEVGITAECAKEAANALSAMMSGKVPRTDRALALEGLLDEVSSPCVRHVENVRSSGPAMSAVEDADAIVMEPPVDSYVEVTRLLMSLLSDGLPCLSLTDDSTNTDRETTIDVVIGTMERISTFGAAVKAVGAIVESFRLGGATIEDRQWPEDESVAAGDGMEGDVGGFPSLLCEALSLVRAAVCRDVVPGIHGEASGAVDVVRALVDTLGALARPSSNSSGRFDSLSRAYRLAVCELSGICGGEKTEAGDWGQLGLPLRRRACWQLLRCVWTTARRFREMEDADAKDGGLDSAVEAAADRCTCVLAALGKLEVAPGLLTANFRKLVADKQAQEKRYPSRLLQHNRNLSPPSSVTSNASAGESSVIVEREDVEWATLAEDDDTHGVANGSQKGRLEGGGEESEDQGHLMIVVRALLMCTASRSSLRVRQAAAELLGEADMPRAVDALQDEVAALKKELQKRDAQFTKKEEEVKALRAQLAAGTFM